MDDLFETIGKIVAIGGSVVTIIIAVASILSKFGIVDMFIKRLSKKYDISDEYRVKKDSALEELLSEFNSFYTNADIILVPRYKCPAREGFTYFIPMSYLFLEDVEQLQKYIVDITKIISKNQFWFSNELNTQFSHYLGLIRTIYYVYMLGLITPNKLFAYFISFDLNNMQSKISQEIKKCYYGKHKTKNTKISIGKFWNKMNRSHKDSAFATFSMLFANEEQKREFSYINYKESRFYKHYELCMSCDIDCPLAKQDFINWNKME